MALDAIRGYRALRRGRHSVGDAEYFITFCTEERRAGLETIALTTSLLAELGEMERGKNWSLQCAVIMPDHVHLLLQLGESRSLGKCVARFKFKTRSWLKTQGLKWQSGFFDRHLRSNEDRMPYFLSVYRNPYRAELLPIN